MRMIEFMAGDTLAMIMSKMRAGNPGTVAATIVGIAIDGIAQIVDKDMHEEDAEAGLTAPGIIGAERRPPPLC